MHNHSLVLEMKLILAAFSNPQHGRMAQNEIFLKNMPQGIFFLRIGSSCISLQGWQKLKLLKQEWESRSNFSYLLVLALVGPYYSTIFTYWNIWVLVDKLIKVVTLIGANSSSKWCNQCFSFSQNWDFFDAQYTVSWASRTSQNEWFDQTSGHMYQPVRPLN